MADNAKFNQMVAELVQRTAAKKLTWEADADSEMFYLNLSDYFIECGQESFAGSVWAYVKLRDKTGRVIESMNGRESAAASNYANALYVQAKASALGIDDAIDDVIRRIRSS